MRNIDKNFIIKFLIAFGTTLVIALLLIFLVFRGIFANAYIKKGNAMLEKTNYDQAIEFFNTAKTWKKSNADIYLSLAKAYIAKEDFDTAGQIIDDAISSKITSDASVLEQLHLMRIKIYSEAGKLNDAVNYTDLLRDQYISKKVQSARPSDIVYSPTQGSYDRNLKMSITVREGETVYYTTDGSYPTKFSNTYTAPINIGPGTTKITAISVDANGLVSPMLNIEYVVTNDNQPVTFDDEKIEKMVKKALSKTSGIVLVKELESITELSNDGIEGYVRTLSDLDLMPNLESLCLANEKYLTSISQLSGKTKLKTLYLSGCALDSTKINALGSLTALEFLDISSNDITSINALSELTAIKYIYLSGNMISDLSPLAKSGGIEFIDASNNKVSAIPDFNTAEKLTTMILKNNMVADISTIHRLSSLTYLDLQGNMFSNAKNIESLTKLESLVIGGNPIKNFDFLKKLKSLTSLDVSGTDFLSLAPVSALPLTSLSASDTDLTTVDALENLTDLTYLTIANTNVTDIKPVASLKKLDYLDISNLQIEDPAPLFTMENLTVLKAAGLDFKGIVFANPDIQIIE